MMLLIGVVLIILVAIVLIALKDKNKRKPKERRDPEWIKTEVKMPDKPIEETEVSNSKYFKKQPLSVPEQVMFHKLKLCLPNHIILAQVAFSQMIGAEDGTKKENDSKFARAKQKVADFVICDKAFNIIAAIEIDDKSHKKETDEARDQILMEAGIPTIRWKAVNLPNDGEIKQAIALLKCDSAGYVLL